MWPNICHYFLLIYENEEEDAYYNHYSNKPLTDGNTEGIDYFLLLVRFIVLILTLQSLRQVLESVKNDQQSLPRYMRRHEIERVVWCLHMKIRFILSSKGYYAKISTVSQRHVFFKSLRFKRVGIRTNLMRILRGVFHNFQEVERTRRYELMKWRLSVSYCCELFAFGASYTLIGSLQKKMF
jgi:hypothetical protein